MSWESGLLALSALGSNVFALGFAAAFALYLHLTGQKGFVAGWLYGLMLCLGLLLASKLLGYGLIGRTPEASFVSPSSHAAFATFCFLSVGWHASRDRGTWARLAALTVAGTIAGLVSVSRIALEQHTVWEIIVGLAFGLGAVLVFANHQADDAGPALPVLWTLFALIVLGRVALGMQTLTPEDVVQNQAERLFGIVKDGSP